MPEFVTQRGFAPFTQALTKLSFWVLISCGLLLCIPESIAFQLGIDQWRALNGHHLGLTWIAALAFLLMRVLNALTEKLLSFVRDKRQARKVEHKLALLDPCERALLREFFLQSSAVLTMPADEPAVVALHQAGVLAQVGDPKHYAIQGPTAEFKIALAARKRLSRRLLRLPEGSLDEGQKQKLLASRPGFSASICKPRLHTS
ncbi:superinfection exclusion B family protein [Paraferrimonas sedimenticola]|uniref:Superinfection exclusion protein B n=1 Tax=Paraferrimonas sedimenticola TaxID=375674 RepID=A0AA37RVG0_9GAMM|nr:superinfection exclusion B family protein [Paraferrimonas sedimenticola]GLP95582.1 hypothetical protein GCM10007895_08880 [Paraferrimonas sedimenticola]